MKLRSSLLLSALALTLPAYTPGLRGQTAVTLTTLHSFTGTDGSAPTVGPILATDGNLYGTTSDGGSNGAGTVFKITRAGVLTTLYNFAADISAGPGLVQGSNGNFYGTTGAGGSSNAGTVFEITPAGVFTTLYSFTGSGTDGSTPVAGLILGRDGNFYGTTYQGGSGDVGTVFRMTPAGVVTTLHSFAGDGTEGESPESALVQGSDGDLYGTASEGGTGSNGTPSGTVFRMTVEGAITILHNFSNTGTDGAIPATGLVEGRDGNFYGTTSFGGDLSAGQGNGTIYRVTPAGVYTALHSFEANGYDPSDGLIQSTDGDFFGTTSEGGGSSNAGTLFRITSAGVYTPVYNFTGTGTNGISPGGNLCQASDGSFYGTTYSGGSSNDGTIFRLTGASPPVFFTGEVPLSNGVYYLAFADGNYFGYYSFLSDPGYIYHFDLGYEYLFDADDGKSGIYFYDFTSRTFFYTSPAFPFPYLYDFSLNTVLYYYPDPKNAGHYNTDGVRYFYDFATGKIISK